MSSDRDLEINLTEWDFWSYDVWTDEEGNQTVNDRSFIGTVEMPELPNDQDVIESLSDLGYILNEGDKNRITIDEGISTPEELEIILEEDGMMIGQFIKK